MATVQWGAFEYSGGNGMRVGIAVSVSNVTTSSTSVTFTYDVWTDNSGQYADPQVLNFGGSYSGSSSFSYTNNEYTTAVERTTKTYTYNYPAGSYGSSPGNVSFSATVSGAYNGVTPSKVVATAIPARPYAAPNPPNAITSEIEAITADHVLNWNNNPTAQRPYDTITIQRREYIGSSWGSFVTVGTSGGSVESRTFAAASVNKIYDYQIRANNSAGSSSYVGTDPTYLYGTPAAPSGFSATADVGAGEVDLAWTDNSYVSITIYFEIQRSSAGGAWVTIESAKSQSTGVTYTDTSPPPGSVQYRIRTYTNAPSGIRYSDYVSSNTVVTLVDPSTPTAVQPAQGSTVTKPNPQLSATLAAISSGQTQKAEWQIASDSGFTANVHLITESDSDLNASGVHTESPSFVDLLLTNGTWYVRARAVDSYGNLSAWSSGNSFTVNTPVLPTPTTITPTGSVSTMTPTLGATVVSDGAGRTQRVEWQVATNNVFTNNVRTVTQTAYISSGATTSVLPSALKVTYNLGTTWYVRARTLGNEGSSSNWSAAVSFTLSMAAPPTPTLDLPINMATVTTSEPTLGATLSAATEGRRSVAEFQLATNTGFSSNVKTVKEFDSDLRISGYTTEVIPLANKLFQGTWYFRVRAVDEYGQAGSWSAYKSFTVVHKPTASPTSPANNSTLQWNSGSKNFSFGVSDPYPNDTMTAYQIIVERNDTGATLLDTGKVTSSTPVAAIATTAPLLQDVLMRWKVRTWDQDDVAGGYSAYALFSLSALPVVTITSPTSGQEIDTGTPIITWTLDGQTIQYSRRIVITGSGLNYDTGTVITSSQTWTAPQAILSNLMSYSVTVYVTDTQGLTGSSTHNFTTSYEAPDEVTYLVDDTNYENGGYIYIDWSIQEPDGFFIEWHLYRRKAGESEWTIIETYTDQQTNTYKDWLVSNGVVYEYAVTQLGGRSGEILESPIPSSPPSGNADGSHYWLINPYDDTYNLKVSGVKADTYSDEYEEADLIVIGRGRKRNQGTRIGYTGELSAQFRNDGIQTAREKREALQAIKDAQVVCYLRTPFGDIFQVGVGNLSFARIAGTGTNEFVDVTIPYGEVF